MGTLSNEATRGRQQARRLQCLFCFRLGSDPLSPKMTPYFGDNFVITTAYVGPTRAIGMKPAVEKLSEDDMIALAAYLGSLKP
jgi:hypothetical protein